MTTTADRTLPEGYDFIGDVHGSRHKLEGLLQKMGYTITIKPSHDNPAGVYTHHHGRQAVFVGDLIDRGPNQLGVLHIVKAMADFGSARVVMGNHELNALAYATPDPDRPGEFCRVHKPANNHQHAAFLEQLSASERRYFLDWFLRLPLWLDLGYVRVVHACWHEPSRLLVEDALGGNTFSNIAQIADATRSYDKNELYEAVEILLKGPEMDLRPYDLPAFLDKDDHPRHQARVRWWVKGSNKVADLAEVPEFARDATAPDLFYQHISSTLRVAPGTIPTLEEGPPVVYGHYWRTWPTDHDFTTYQPVEGVDWTPDSACVDFSAVRGGPLVAYRWSEHDTKIRPQNYVAYR